MPQTAEGRARSPHGKWGRFWSGCRCDVCHEACPHGTESGYSGWRCRCGRCRTGHRIYKQLKNHPHHQHLPMWMEVTETLLGDSQRDDWFHTGVIMLATFTVGATIEPLANVTGIDAETVTRIAARLTAGEVWSPDGWMRYPWMDHLERDEPEGAIGFTMDCGVGAGFFDRKQRHGEGIYRAIV